VNEAPDKFVQARFTTLAENTITKIYAIAGGNDDKLKYGLRAVAQELFTLLAELERADPCTVLRRFDSERK
jgi:hypothetical protein